MITKLILLSVVVAIGTYSLIKLVNYLYVGRLRKKLRKDLETEIKELRK